MLADLAVFAKSPLDLKTSAAINVVAFDGPASGTLQGDTAVRPGWFKRSRLTGNSSDAGDQNKQDKQTGQKHDVIDVDADGSNNDKSRLEGQPQQGDLLDNVDEG
ncbi:unnamed protein product [Symbiodinium sp. KB8]|nr:unnamed protein product [Symbiodinium sp. KB8]